MLLVSGPIPECSTKELTTVAYSIVAALYAVGMAKSEPKNEAFEKLVEAALKVDPKGLSGKHKAKKTANERKSITATPKQGTQ
jgi:hypothetical protein